MTAILYHFSRGHHCVEDYVKEMTVVVERRLADLETLLTRIKQSDSISEWVALVNLSGLLTSDDIVRLIRLPDMDAEMMALSEGEAASRIARLTALDLCRVRDLHFVADSVDQNKTTNKYLASLEEAKCEQLAWCVLVYNFTTMVRDTVSRITPGLARKWPHCVPGTRINIPIGADHFNAWDCLLSGLAYNTSLSMYSYCRFHAVSPGQAIIISDFSTVDKGQLFSEFTAQIHAAANIYAGNNDQMHPFARICVETPRDCESEWREIARDILKSYEVEWLMPFIYFAPQVVDDTANHKLALSLMGPIETYASHEDMTNQHGSSGTAIITRFNPAVDTDDSYARDVVNGAKLYRKLAKPDLLWWLISPWLIMSNKHMSELS